MSWIEPIYDRTQSDVDYALAMIEHFKDVEGGVTDGLDLKGCVNVSDLTRIDRNIIYLCDELWKYYYFCSVGTSQAWSTSRIPDTWEINRIIGNIQGLLSAYYKPENAPNLPKTLLSYTDINAIEENLFRIKEMLDNMIADFRECGTFNCGEG